MPTKRRKRKAALGAPQAIHCARAETRLTVANSGIRRITKGSCERRLQALQEVFWEGGSSMENYMECMPENKVMQATEHLRKRLNDAAAKFLQDCVKR